jgi:branched-chain amino acid transport system permease protein
MEYLIHLSILICIYIILASSMNLIAGYSGLLSVCHASFFGIGAYTTALLSLHFAIPFLLIVTVAVLISLLFGVLIGVPSLRIHNDYFVIATFGFQVLTFSILNNWVSLTRGPLGLPGIPNPVIFGWQVSSSWEFLILASVVCCVVLWITFRISDSPFGRILKTIREDELYARTIGKNVAAYKIKIFAIGAGLAALSGVLYSSYISFVDPSSFTVMESIFILSIVIIGGAGSFWGPVVGSIVLITLPELLRLLGIPSAIAANIRQILYGSLLIFFMLWRPNGLLGRYSFEKEALSK